MEKESKKISLLNQICSQYTENNKDKLLKTAESLLVLQKENSAIIAEKLIKGVGNENV